MKRNVASRGSILVGLIVTMVVFSALGVAMLPLVSTSTFGFVGANNASRAYYLAESAYRYAMHRFRNAPEPTADTTLESLHTTSQTSAFTLRGNAGQFKINVYPRYYKVVSNPFNTNSLVLRIPGGKAADFVIPAAGFLFLEKTVYEYTNVSDGLVFTMKDTMPFFPSGTDVFPVARSDSSASAQSVPEGGNLYIQTGTHGTFPKFNGMFQFNGRVYTYREMKALPGDATRQMLQGIFHPSGDTLVPFTVPPSSDIILGKYVDILATGISGENGLSVNRDILYHVPLPFTPSAEKQEFTDDFENLSAWNSSAQGAHEIQTIGGDKALKVTDTDSGLSPKESEITLNWSDTPVDLDKSYSSSGGFLSYDTQVKVGFTADSGSDPWPNQPNGVPRYYVAGISFRVDGQGNRYGLSFLRGNNTLASPYDNINDPLVPKNDQTMIVLWQQTGNGANQKWLAYKQIEDWIFFRDEVASLTDTKGWTTGGLWHPSITSPAGGFGNSWYYGQDTPLNYNTGGRNSGSLTSPQIHLISSVKKAVLKFRSWYETEPYDPFNPSYVDNFDQKFIEISTNGGTTWSRLLQIVHGTNPSAVPYPIYPMGIWQDISIPLDAYIGQDIRIRFRFDTIDALFNENRGWYIDNVVIESDDFDAFPINEATLAVRLLEATAVAFDNGGPNPMKDGSTLTGQTSGAVAILEGNPILRAGSADWASGSAAGVLTLKKVTGEFLPGETLQVTGSFTTVRIAAQPQNKVNFIRAFYGDISGYGTPDADALNYKKKAHPRGTVQWPPKNVSDWSSLEDYFTLVQWDRVNSAASSAGIVSSTDEPDAIIQSTESALLSPDAGTIAQSEIGLHAFGHGATKVYFDDFGLQADVQGDPVYPPAIQE